jgi:hypothetical protein
VPRNPNDIVCGREITHHTTGEIFNILRDKFMPKKSDLKDAPLDLYNKTSLVIRSIIHLTNVQMPAYRVDDAENNLALRVNYMRKKIDKDTFQTNIQRANKKHEKKRDIRDILQLFVQTVTDILFRFMAAVKNAPVNPNEVMTMKKAPSNPNSNDELVNTLNTILSEIKNIERYANECLLDISNTYGSKPTQIKIYRTMLPPYIQDDVLIPVEVTKQAKTKAN